MRLEALYLYSLGYKLREIAERTGLNANYISQLVTKFINEGIDAIANDGRTDTHNRKLSKQEELELLEGFVDMAADGRLVTAIPIKLAFEELTGEPCNKTTIYRLLKRHKWKKKVARRKHPGKATPEEINSSKKLRLVTRHKNVYSRKEVQLKAA
jgi:transposase